MKVNSKQIFTTNVKFDVKAVEDSETLTITGFASTNDQDRQGDIIAASAWQEPSALKDYLNNPIILAQHDHTKPIGLMTDHEATEKGLKITAEISEAAGTFFKLIKEGILKTFSVGFRIKDADWNTDLDAFLIKSVELLEISVVSIPANQSALFSVQKSFSNDTEYLEFKKQFNPKIEEPIKMDPKETLSAEAVAAIVAKAISDNQKSRDELKTAEKEVDTKVTIAVTEAVDRLEADQKKALENINQEKETLEAAIKKMAADMSDQTAELNAAKKNKLQYTKGQDVVDKSAQDTAVFIAKAMDMPISKTQYFQDMATKSGEEHWAAGAQTTDWEQSFSTSILNEVRAQLRVESAFTKVIVMPTASFHLPINGEAGLSEWIATAALRGSGSTGTDVDHELKDITLTAKKMTAKEFVGYEEEEDTLIAIMPIVRDAIARRMARGSDRSFLLGSDSGMTGAAAGILGMNDYATALSTTLGIGAGDVLTAANLTALRASLGIYGLDTSQLVYFVSIVEYYNLLEDDLFKTIDLIGDKATLLTGQVGMVGAVPVVITDETETIAATQAAAYCVNVTNFIKGEMRGMTIETDRDIIEQKNIIVASRRLDFIPLTANKGAARLNYAV